MKKILFFFLILVSAFSFLVSPIIAIGPVIITKAKPGAAPPDAPFTQDQNYYPNDFTTGAIVCNGTYGISKTFQPDEKTTTDSEGNKTTTFIPYDATRIDGNPMFSNTFWTNMSLPNFRAHVASRPIAIANADDTAKAFLSLDPNKTNIGSFGAARRTMSSSYQRCLRGERMVNAVKLRMSGDLNNVADEQVAWSDGTSVVGNERGSGTPILLSDVAHALNTQPFLDLSTCGIGITQTLLFYDVGANCNLAGSDDPAAPQPAQLNWIVSPLSPPAHQISLEFACRLYKSSVDPYDIGSSMRKVKTYSLKNDQPVDHQMKKTSVPWGNLFATKPSFATLIMPSSQEIPPADICATSKEDYSENKPNPVSFFVYAEELFGRIIDTAQTFGKTMHYSYTIEKSIQDGIAADEAALKDIIPSAVQKDSCIASTNSSSSTDGKSFDPGNPCTRNVFTKQLLPKSWQTL